MGEMPQGRSGTTSDHGQSIDEILTPRVRAVLADLAVSAETCTDLGEAVGLADRTLKGLLEWHPEFNGPSRELLAKMAILQRHLREAGSEIARFAHSYEDATVAGFRRD